MTPVSFFSFRSTVVDLCGTDFDSDDSKPISSFLTKKREKVQAKLDQIRLKVNCQKDNDDAEERRHRAFTTYENATMAFTRATNSSSNHKRHGGARQMTQLDLIGDKGK
jgi:hypothetical protein